MDQQNRNIFWPSLSDLMTALFAVVLVLFVLSYTLFADREQSLQKEQAEKDAMLRRYQVLVSDYERLQKIEKQIRAFENTGVFRYDSTYRRFLLKEFIGKEIFASKDSIILPQFHEAAERAGRLLMNLVDTLYKKERIRFLILIEGNTANYEDGSIDKDNVYGYKLSYRRALALYLFWKERGIEFNPAYSEVLLAGSGFSGVGRDTVSEGNNKRFVIQIIPKLN